MVQITGQKDLSAFFFGKTGHFPVLLIRNCYFLLLQALLPVLAQQLEVRLWMGTGRARLGGFFV
jgi:hypothetical protein